MSKRQTNLLPLRILLVEDSPVNQRLAVRLLESQGHAVTVADNGREAFHAAQLQVFDVILMDVEMPEIDGLTATRLIRAHEGALGLHTPIVAVTSNDNRDECIRAGMDDFLSKGQLAQFLDCTLAKVVRKPAA